MYLTIISVEMFNLLKYNDELQHFHFVVDRPRARWLMYLGDFANMFKAFIGSNYLGVAYAFKQSGLAVCILEILYYLHLIILRICSICYAKYSYK